MKIADIISAIEDFAPLPFQEEYDNSGLQVGDPQAEATGALLCIDVTEAVVEEAILKNANLIVSHHPLLFKGIKSVTGKSYIERIIIKAIRNNIAIYAAHTNLDNVKNGVNYRIAAKLGLENVRILSPQKQRLSKLVTYVPENRAGQLRKALFEAGAGHIGNYDSCSYNLSGTGTFRALDGANPYCGEIGELHKEEECRIEVIFPNHIRKAVVDALCANHPYEEPAYDLLPLDNVYENAGGGIIGELTVPEDERTFLQKAKNIFGSRCVKHSPLLNRLIRKIALCGGSGSSLIPAARTAGADIFITGEIKYHDYFDVENRIVIAEFGHYETEQYTKDIFYDIIIKKFPTFAAYNTTIETNPINYL